MKIKENYILREIAGTYMVVPCGEELQKFNGMITLNETGAFLWKMLASHQTPASLTQALLDTYEVEAAVAEKDVAAFLDAMRQGNLLVEA